MILQSLVRYYETMAEKGKIAPLGYGRSKVSYGLSLREDGALVGVVPLLETVQAGKKTVERPQNMLVPEPVVRSVGIVPNFLCDISSYIVGYDEKGKPERTRACFEASKALHLSILQPVDSPMARAIVAFFEAWNIDGAAENEHLLPYLSELAKGANLIFMLNMQYAQEDEDIKVAWMKHSQEKVSEDQMVCLVSGERAPIARLHPKIKGVKDAQSVGASLVSFNARAFESYGREDEQGLNAPVSEYAAFAYTTALNALIADERHRTYLGDMTIVHWSEDANEAPSEIMGLNLNMTVKADAETTDALLKDVFTKLKAGDPLDGDIDLQCPFCILALAPNAARLSVRFFLRDTFGTLIKNLQKHYEDMEIVHAPFEKEYVLFPDILSELSNPNATTKQAPEITEGTLVCDVIKGSRYPAAMYATVQMRIRADRDDPGRRIQKIGRARAAIVKAYLLRNSTNPEIKGACDVALNPESTQPAYVLGRLFSVLEQIQEAANPGINSTIKDRYFNAACATPGTVFPTLIKLSNHHLRKLDAGHRIYLEKQVSDLIGMLDARPYPTRLTLEEQGLFEIGYYHQNQARYTRKEEASSNE